jgi:uncharacterized protein YjbI with pentapeptide repeats
VVSNEQLETLRAGYSTWNEWRRKRSELLIDLAGADLTDADLRGCNLFSEHSYDIDDN